MEGGPLREKNPKKILTMPKKTEKADPLVSPGIVCYAEKKKHVFGSVR